MRSWIFLSSRRQENLSPPMKAASSLNREAGRRPRKTLQLTVFPAHCPIRRPHLPFLGLSRPMLHRTRRRQRRQQARQQKIMFVISRWAAKFRSLAMPWAPSSGRSEEHTSELQSLMRISYAVFCLKKKKHKKLINNTKPQTKTHKTTHKRK